MHTCGPVSADVLHSTHARAGQCDGVEAAGANRADGATRERVTDTAIEPLVVRLKP